MKGGSVMVAVGVLFAASSAHAQSHMTSGAFVQGGLFASIELLAHSYQDPDVAQFVLADPSGTVAGGTIGIGAFLRPFFTLRAEVAVPATLDQQEERIIGGLSMSSRGRVQNRDAYVLLGFETNPDRRIRLSYLAGAVVRQQRIRRAVSIVTPGLPPFLPPRVQVIDDTSVAYGTSLALGIEGAATFSRRVSLVPQLRVVVIGGALSVRPGASVRWNF